MSKTNSHPQDEVVPESYKRHLFWGLVLTAILMIFLLFIWPNFADIPFYHSEDVAIVTSPNITGTYRIDYLAVIEGPELAKDRHENGFRMVLAAVGSEPTEVSLSSDRWAAICEKLDLDPLAPPTMPFYANADKRILEQDEKSPNISAHRQIDECLQNLWTDEHYPVMGKYVDEISPLLDLAIEAVRKDFYFVPSLRMRDDSDILLPCVSVNRRIAVDLLVRANRSIANGDFDSAWRDIDAAMRLGAYLQGHHFVTSSNLGYGIFYTGWPVVVRFLQESELSKELLQKCFTDLQSWPDLNDAMERRIQSHRFGSLDMIDYYSSASRTERNMLESDLPKKASSVLGIDWTLAAKAANRFFDELEQLQNGNLTDHEKITEYEQIMTDLNARFSGNGIGLYLSRGCRSNHIAIKNCYHYFSYDIFVKMDRLYQIRRQLLAFAFELEAEKQQNGRYPATLDFLNDRYTQEQLTDPINKIPFVYRPNETGDGYLLYSVGWNGIDENGSWIDTPGLRNMTTNDDIGITIP